jgi:hypothetical protein
MAVRPDQLDVVRRALAVAQSQGASPRETKALVEALGVESNYTDLSGGDRDSAGALQQRPSQGWGPASESLETDVQQFLTAARKANTVGGSAGQLAQAVQRSAFPERYQARGGEAEQLIASLTGQAPATAAASTSSSGGMDTSSRDSGLVSLLGALQQRNQRPAVQTVGLQGPSFAAGPALPQGYQAPQSGGSASAGRPALADLLQGASSIEGPTLPGASGGSSGAGQSRRLPR